VCPGGFPPAHDEAWLTAPGAPVLVHEVFTAFGRLGAGGEQRRCVLLVQGVLPASAGGRRADSWSAPVLVHEVLIAPGSQDADGGGRRWCVFMVQGVLPAGAGGGRVAVGRLTRARMRADRTQPAAIEERRRSGGWERVHVRREV
jgi:hypothetical protein